MEKERKKLLLHACCAPCLTHVYSVLAEKYLVTVLFYNPNIHPMYEYTIRRNELETYAKQHQIPYIIIDEGTDDWFKQMKGLEKEKEGGLRCGKCYAMRLEKTAQYAKENGYDLFTTVLSISPHKNAKKINEIGKMLAQQYDIAFLEADFKKKNGFKISCELSRKNNLYRQQYCGCLFSIRREDIVSA